MKLLLALPVAILAGCRNPAPGYVPVTPPTVVATSLQSVKSPKDLMPLGVGNNWKYALHNERFDAQGKQVKNTDVNAEVEVESRWPDGTAVLVFRVGGNVVDRQAWATAEEGVYQVEGGIHSGPIRPAMPLFLIPLKLGRKTRWHGRAPSLKGDLVPSTETLEVLAPQTVNLRRGAVSAIPISSAQTFGEERSDSIAFFQPGTGIVRLQQETRSKGIHETLTFTLLEHTTKP